MRKVNDFRIRLVVFILLLLLLAAVLFCRSGRNENHPEYSERYVGIEEIKTELGFYFYTQEEWDSYFEPFQKNYLTGNMLGELLQKLGVAEYIEHAEAESETAVSREEWNHVYEQILDYLDTAETVEKKTYLVLGTMEAENENVIITNLGDIYTSLPISFFHQWNAYELYINRVAENSGPEKENCMGIAGKSKEETNINNAYLKALGTEHITFLYDGAEYEKDVANLGETIANGVCDLVFLGGEISTIRMKQDVIQGELMSYDDTAIEIKGYGRISHQGKLPVYQTYGEVVEKSISNVILGNMQVDYVTGGGEVCAILIPQPAEIQNIRVLLLAEDGGKYRSDVYLKCTSSSVISCGEQNEAVEAETLIHVSDYLSGNAGITFAMVPDDVNATIRVCDAGGAPVSNGYYGSMEVRFYSEGYTLVNQLPFESYLYAVVPSEMPSTYEPEALKAQAVCARSYAYMQLMRADLAEYGAHINDSTSYQVYNKVEQTKSAIDAVNATSGQVLTFQGEIIEAYYFSTSMGYTETVEIWNTADTEKYGYLQAACLDETAYEGDLSDEAQFLSYIKDNRNGYDSGLKYSRWFASADYRQKTAEINEILRSRRSISPENVLYYESNGTTETDTTEGMGNVTGLSVENRSKSGSILTLRIQYENGIVKVKTEYNVRKVLGCGVTKMVYADSSEGGNTGMLPSAFASISAEADGTYLLQGGGYGHGLGMSQNGANGMAKTGMTYEEILHYFYFDTQIENMMQ